ncbi:MAG TPA: transglycosylase SLT domain-containing protein [Bacteriovoracaceae bacterium]|nr:transglycosylase SLT domain-containing protein [Bacteriovoracaceae bacterium]
MYKLLAVLLLGILIFFTASDPFFGTSLSFKPLPDTKPSDVREFPWVATRAFRNYLTDHDQRVDDAFTVTPYYYPNVHFWFLIYTQFESSQVVIHDKKNLNIIYRVLDFNSLYTQNLSGKTLWFMQQRIADEKLAAFKQELIRLEQDPFNQSPESREILGILENAEIRLPSLRGDRSTFFQKLKDNLRTQTGQKNYIRDGIVRALPYQKFLTDYFKKRNLPPELLAIPFLESSFNPGAQSKAAAVGAWQFMPLISSYFVPKRTSNYDYRSNVGVASVAAAFLMNENYNILRTWDLAVTAYNSGTKHLLKTKREIGSQADLEEIIKHSDSEHFGFASKNFYSEFLALVHTLAYKDELFRNLDSDRSDTGDDLLFFQTKCSLRLDKELNQHQLEDFNFHNHHLRDIKNPVPKGFIVTLKTNLPSQKFEKVSESQLLKTKPIKWYKSLSRSSCKN